MSSRILDYRPFFHSSVSVGPSDRQRKRHNLHSLKLQCFCLFLLYQAELSVTGAGHQCQLFINHLLYDYEHSLILVFHFYPLLHLLLVCFHFPVCQIRTSITSLLALFVL